MKPRKPSDAAKNKTPLTAAHARRLTNGITESRPEDHQAPNPDQVALKRIRHRIEDLRLARELGVDVEDLT